MNELLPGGTKYLVVSSCWLIEFLNVSNILEGSGPLMFTWAQVVGEKVGKSL